MYATDKNYVYLKSAKRHVKPGFFNFNKITDTNNLLEGTEKSMRHIKISNIDNFDINALKEMITQTSKFEAKMGKSILLTVLIFFLALTISKAQANEATKSSIKSFSLLVEDYDEAIEFYTKKLDFDLVTDQKFGANMRWVSLKAPNSEIQMTLGKASGEERKYIGKQMGENYPIFVMTVKDVQKTYETYTSQGVNFLDKPTKKPWGIGAVFEDLYGNKIYLQTE